MSEASTPTPGNGYPAHPLSTGQVYSNAFNFLSAIDASVDPRTGLYSASVSLPIGAANQLRGPEYSLRLSFSALNAHDTGFGQGWALSATTWDSAAKCLQLSSGERLRSEISGETMSFPDTPLPGVKVVVNRDEMWVRHNDGKTECLSRLPGHASLWTTDTLSGADGSALHFEWVAIAGVQYLNAIKDATGRTIVSCVYDGQQTQPTQLTFQPGTPAQKIVSFYRTGNELRRIEVDALSNTGWRFEYTNDSTGLLLMTACHQPSGSLETVTYSTTGGLQLPPGGPFARMPVVVRRRLSPGDGIADQITTYDYTLHGDSNYFGWPAVRQWRDHEDNLYFMTGAAGFLYGSTETLIDMQEKPLLSTKRTFNRFHLLTKETTTRGQALSEVATTYYDDPSLPIAAQKPYFQFPHVVTTRVAAIEAGRTVRERSTEEESRYDDLGNVIWHRTAVGTVEVSTYYPPSGTGDDCPPDPQQRISRLESKTVFPPAGTSGPVKQTRYRYVALPVRQDAPISVLPTYIQSSEETLLLVEGETCSPLGSSTQALVNDPTSPHHGRLARETFVQDGLVTERRYSHALVTAQCALGTEIDTLQVTTTIIGHDGHSQVTHAAQDLYSGQSVREGNDGNSSAHSYDGLGRKVVDVIAPGTPFESRVSWSYTITPQSICQTRTGPTGQLETTWFNALGQEVRRENQDDAGNLYTSWSAEYDAFGQQISETQSDPGNADTPTLHLKTVRSYDDWGNVDSETAAHGVTQHTLNDPVALTTTTWQTSHDGQKGPDTVTTYTPDGRPLLEQSLALDDKVHQERRWAYDGLGRCISQVDSMGQETRQTWDALDRLICTQLPDGAQIRRCYAPGHNAELPASLSISHPTLGSEPLQLGHREYDGLGRLVMEQVGRGATHWEYEAGQNIATAHVQADGTRVKAGHIPELDGALASIQAGNITLSNTYHPVTGHLLTSTNENGVRTEHWSSTGNLTQVDYQWPGDQPRSQYQRLTPQGMLTHLTDVDGAQQLYFYDEYGRLIEQRSQDASVTLTYDAFSRIRQRQTQSNQSSTYVSVTFDYDAFSRPFRRNTHMQTPGRELVEIEILEWRRDGKISARALARDGTPIRSETFDYDVRGRLVLHAVQGSELPKDAHGQAYACQTFHYDALDNLLRLETRHAGNLTSNATTYEYDPVDRTQLVRIAHSHPDYPAPVTLAYDALGNLTHDERGNALKYDALGRLAAVTLPSGEKSWLFGPTGDITMTQERNGCRWRYHIGRQLTCELGDDSSVRWMQAAGVPVAQTTLSASIREVLLLSTNAHGSVTNEAADTISSLTYGAYGHDAGGQHRSRLGFGGELRESETGWYFLGDYRVYNPVLMRFHSRDNLSPFGEGGLNGYCYCNSDPVNRIDPSGHSWLLDWLVPVAGIVLGVIGTITSFGALAGLTAALTVGYVTAVTTATLGVSSLVTEVAALTLLAAGQEEASGILGWVGMGMGLASAAPAIASGVAKGAKAAAKAVSKGLRHVRNKVEQVQSFVGQWQYKLQHASGGRTLPDIEMAAPRSSPVRADLFSLPRSTQFAIAAQDSDAFRRLRVHAHNNGYTLRLPDNDVPDIRVRLRPHSETSVRFFANNPNYVNAVRHIASNRHPYYPPSMLAEAGIDAENLMITTREIYNAGAVGYRSPTWEPAMQLLGRASELARFSDVRWGQSLMSASPQIWSRFFPFVAP